MHKTKKYLDDYNGQEKELHLAQNDVRCEDENFNVNDEDPEMVALESIDDGAEDFDVYENTVK